VRKNKKKILEIFKLYIEHNKKKAKAGLFNYDDDIKTYKMIYALAELFPVDEKYYRNEPEVEKFFKQLWYLYYFFKESIEGNKVKYSNIVAKYC
tara:strand:+ start:1383 stop:1664 length:282 start_codon:yes stop_codon:yes gene_type:complete